MAGVTVPYRSPRPLRGTRHLAGGRLGALGLSPLASVGVKTGSTLVGVGAGSLIGTAAGTAGGALFGAAAGSVVPVIGTVIGAVVGILTSKLFGKANYAAVYASVANVVQLFSAYQQVAGQYVGRNYGWPEIQYIWHGAMHSGLFPGNGPPPGVACTQAMISKQINACGTGQWIDDLLGTSQPTASYPGSIANLIYKGLQQGITDPVTMTNNVLVPGMETLAAGKNNGWISVARSANPALYKQLLMDTADYMMSVSNPSMPAYYGTQNIQPLPTNAPAPPPSTTTQYAQAVTVPMPLPVQPVNTQQIAAPGQPMPLPPAQAAQQAINQAALANSVPSAAVVTGANGVVIPPAIVITPTPPAIAAAGGTTAPVDSTAAYLAALEAQGATQNQAMLAAISQLQSQGYTAAAAQSTVAAAAPPYYDPTQVAAVTPQAAPVVPTAAGVTGSTSNWLILGGLGVLAMILATARPAKGKRR